MRVRAAGRFNAGAGRRLGAGSSLSLLAVLVVGCLEPMPMPDSVDFDGRTLHRFSTTRVGVGVLDVYAPDGDHPTTADLTIGFIRSHLSVRHLVHRLRYAHEETVKRSFANTEIDTFDSDRFQTCRVYVDDIGQPALAFEVAERYADASVSTAAVWELDNLEQAQKGLNLCREVQNRLGRVWALHRTYFRPKVSRE